jgi:hypothetical protein
LKPNTDGPALVDEGHSAAIRLTTSSGVNIGAIAITSSQWVGFLSLYRQRVRLTLKR